MNKMNQEESKNLIKGVVIGIVAALIGSLIWKEIAISTGKMYGLIALIIAALAGAGFGYPTKGGNKTARGVIGAVLGLLAIILGYYFIYTSPIEFADGTFVPASIMSFGTFWNLMSSPVDYIFLLIGLYEGAKLGSI